MRSFRHLTPRYVVDRLGVMLHQRLRPDDPWLARGAIRFLDQVLRPSDIVLEWGSGKSTAWFAARVASLTSIEHDASWHARVGEMCARRGLSNVDLRLVETTRSEPDSEASVRYGAAAEQFANGSLDVAVVDGLVRDRCLLGVIPKMKPGGIIVLDNANWYLPSDSRAPSSVPADGRPVSEGFAEAASLLENWRRYRTSDGVWDTWLWFAPI